MSITIFYCRWLGVHLELLGNVVVLAAALFSVFSDLNGALVGLSVVYAIQVSAMKPVLIRIVTNFCILNRQKLTDFLH